MGFPYNEISSCHTAETAARTVESKIPSSSVQTANEEAKLGSTVVVRPDSAGLLAAIIVLVVVWIEEKGILKTMSLQDLTHAFITFYIFKCSAST